MRRAMFRSRALVAMLALALVACGSIIIENTPVPAAPQAAAPVPRTGHWTGEPAVSFDITEDGAITAFSMIAPVGVIGEHCTITSQRIELEKPDEFVIGAPDNGSIYVTARFSSPTTVSGIFKISACVRGDQVSVYLSPQEKEWSASWQGTRPSPAAGETTAGATQPPAVLPGVATQPPVASVPTMPPPTVAPLAPLTSPQPAAAPPSPAPRTATISVQATRVAIFEGDSGKLAWMPNSTILLIGDYRVRVYDTTSKEVVRSLESDGRTGIALTTDGAVLAVAGSDGVQLWDTAAWGTIRTLEGSRNTRSMAFSPDGSTLLTGIGEALKLWDVAQGTELRTIPVGDPVYTVAFSPDGRTLASGSHQTISLWDASSGQLLRTLDGQMRGLVHSIAFAPDGQMLVSGSADHTVRLWDVASGQQMRVFDGHTDRVESVAFSPDGRLLVSASADLTIRVWDVASGSELQSLTGHTSWVSAVAFSPDGTLLASGSGDEMRLWQIAVTE